MAQTVSGAEAPSGYDTHPEHKINVALAGRPVRVTFKDQTVAQSRHALILRESGHKPVIYFPRNDVVMPYLQRTDHVTTCPFKGAASYWTVQVGEAVAENAAWSYEDPLREIAGIQNYVAFYWDRMTSWLANDQTIDQDAL